MKPQRTILITSGPTWVMWDAVRVIGNVSSGRLGRLLARALARRHFKITLLEGPVPHHKIKDLTLPETVRIIPFEWFDQLKNLLKDHAGRHDIVIHAAAVSDFLPHRRARHKISSRRRSLTLTLKPAPKLIRSIKQWAPEVHLVGFKLMPQADERALFKAAKELFDNGCDWVVGNRIHPDYTAWIFQPNAEVIGPVHGRGRLAARLAGLISSGRFIK